MFKYKLSQVFHEVTLSTYYEDGDHYYTTNDFYAIRDFLNVVNVPSKNGALISVVEGEFTSQQNTEWYRRSCV